MEAAVLHHPDGLTAGINAKGGGSVKKDYLKPIVSIDEFKIIDVITTSGTETDDNDVPWGS